MNQVTATLNPLGWTLPVLPELDTLTVGGLVCGVGVETSSHLHGLFQHTCVAFEIVLADGSVRRCTADAPDEQDRELFRAIPWSHGTLGFLVGVEIKIVPAKPWVRLEYTPVQNKEQAVALCREKFAGQDDFVEALVYGRDQWVVMTGNMADRPQPDGRVNRIGRFWKPWFFTHVRSFLTNGQASAVEYLPLRDYYHRHTRSLFWEIQDIITFGNDWWFRYGRKKQRMREEEKNKNE